MAKSTPQKKTYIQIGLIATAIFSSMLLAFAIYNSKLHGTKATSESVPQAIDRGDQYKKMIALTFDSDSTDKTTAQILDVLKEKQLKCTIFLTGEMVKKHPDIAKRIITDGHEVGSHGYSHTHFDELTDQQFIDEMTQTRTLFFQITGQPMIPYWRPPGLVEYKSKLQLATDLGFGDAVTASILPDNNIGFSLDSFDWVDDKTSPNYYTADQIRDRLLKPINKNGGIFLFHLQNRKKDPVVTVLPQIIDGLEAQGYQIVPITTLLENKVF